MNSPPSSASPSSARPSGFAAWLYRVVPALDSLRTYSAVTFRRDLFAGLTVAAVAVPQAMAYATIVGLPVEYGLYTAIVMTAVGALFDSSRQLINGPTNAISIAVLSAIGALALTDPAEIAQAAVLLALLVGLIQTGIALLKLGDLTRFISHAVIVGFTTGASLLLVLDQMKNLLGLRAQGEPHDHFLVRLWRTHFQGGAVNYTTLALGAGSIALVLLLGALARKLALRLPELLLTVVAAAAVVGICQLDKPLQDDQGNAIRPAVAVIGNIPRGLPSFTPPTLRWDWIQKLSGSALAIALLGVLEAMSMAKAIAHRTRQKLDMNQQCLSEGLANTAGSFFQCYPGSGSLTRSAINHQAGAVTQWSGVISALAVALTVLLFAPWARYIPKAALAGVLMVSAFRMIDTHKLAYHIRVTRMDAAIVVATAVAAIAVSIEFCILIGTFLSFLIYVPRAARLTVTQLVVTPERVVRERVPADPPCSRLLIYNVEGELFFGAGPDLEDQLGAVEQNATSETRIIVLRLKNARNLDGVCLDILGDFLEREAAKEQIVLLCGVREAMLEVLRNVGLEKRLGPKRIFPEGAAVWSSTLDAIRHAYFLLGEDTCPTCPVRSRDLFSENRDWYYMI